MDNLLELFCRPNNIDEIFRRKLKQCMYFETRLLLHFDKALQNVLYNQKTY